MEILTYCKLISPFCLGIGVHVNMLNISYFQFWTSVLESLWVCEDELSGECAPKTRCWS